MSSFGLGNAQIPFRENAIRNRSSICMTSAKFQESLACACGKTGRANESLISRQWEITQIKPDFLML